MCVPAEKVCDGHNDCGDWRDEPKGLCRVNECADGANGGCDHKCVDLPAGFRCECKRGYELKGNATCVGE